MIYLLILAAVFVVTLAQVWRARRRTRQRIAHTQRPPAPIEPKRQTFRVSPVNRHRARRDGQRWRDN
jgi:hypothetical protein